MLVLLLLSHPCSQCPGAVLLWSDLGTSSCAVTLMNVPQTHPAPSDMAIPTTASLLHIPSGTRARELPSADSTFTRLLHHGAGSELLASPGPGCSWQASLEPTFNLAAWEIRQKMLRLSVKAWAVIWSEQMTCSHRRREMKAFRAGEHRRNL